MNELLARDVDGDTSDDFTLAYDAVGNLTDDGESYTYQWDAFGRLRKILNRSNSNLVAEYRYNGLGYRIGIHEDTDTDGDVDSNDKWYYHAFDERWRWVATFRESDSSPKEEFLHHAAGFDGQGTGSYIDMVVLRNRDANTAWTSASDGTLEERLYYCQNWRADVVALVTAAGGQVEQVRYSAYGVPFGLPAGDCDSDGDCDANDDSVLAGWMSFPVSYDVRGDVNLNGILDSADALALAALSGTSLGRRVGSDSEVGNALLFGGYWQSKQDSLGARYRGLSTVLGRWTSRDPSGYVDGVSLYEFVASRPVGYIDSHGLHKAVACHTCTTAFHHEFVWDPPPRHSKSPNYKKHKVKIMNWLANPNSELAIKAAMAEDMAQRYMCQQCVGHECRMEVVVIEQLTEWKCDPLNPATFRIGPGRGAKISHRMFLTSDPERSFEWLSLWRCAARFRMAVCCDGRASESEDVKKVEGMKPSVQLYMQ